MSGYTIAVGHLGDDTLLVLLDDAPSASTDARVHLLTCSGCSDRLDRLRAASDLFSASLPAVPARLHATPAPSRARWLSYPMIAAASILVVATAAAATPPVREWIIRQFTRVDAPVVAPPVTPTPTVAPSKGMIASFVVADTLLNIRIDRRQPQGEIELVASTSDRVSAQVIANAAAEELVVSPGELRIVNTASSLAGYRITVPTAVRSIRLVVGDGPAVVLGNTPDLNRRIPLR